MRCQNGLQVQRFGISFKRRIMIPVDKKLDMPAGAFIPEFTFVLRGQSTKLMSVKTRCILMVTILPIENIISDPNIRNGQAIVAGSGVRVTDLIASHLYRGHSADELATQFNLTLGQVYAALAYYYQNKAKLDEEMRTQAETAAQLLDKLGAQGKLTRIE